MAQVIEDSKKKNDIEFFPELLHVVDRKFAKFDIEPQRLSGELRLRQVLIVKVDAEHAVGAAPLHFDAVEAAIAADIKHRFTAQILWNGVFKAPPLHIWVVTKKVLRGGLDSPDVDIVKPISKCADVRPDLFGA